MRNRETFLEFFDVDEDSQSGLRWRIDYARNRAGNIAGYLAPNQNERYGDVWHVLVYSRPCVVSRVIWTILNGEIPNKMVVDHRDGNPLNNRIRNLCLKTQGENSRCRTKLHARNRSGHEGVRWSSQRGKWQACIKRKGEVLHLGFFDDKEDAGIMVRQFALTWAIENQEEYRLLN